MVKPFEVYWFDGGMGVNCRLKDGRPVTVLNVMAHNEMVMRVNIAQNRSMLPSAGHAIVSAYTASVRLMPQAAAPLPGRGRVHLAAGRPHAAIRDFSRAVTADPRFATAYRSRAEAKLDIMRAPDAIEDLSRAIAFDANNPELYLLRGQAYLAADNVGAALKDLGEEGAARRQHDFGDIERGLDKRNDAEVVGGAMAGRGRRHIRQEYVGADAVQRGEDTFGGIRLADVELEQLDAWDRLDVG